MSKSNEFLSNLLDDQCSCDELDQLLDDKNTAEGWYRYSLVSAILKNEPSADISTEFSQSLSAKIAQEPAIVATQAAATQASQSNTKDRRSTASSNIFSLGRYTSGMAIAASVAFATFFSVNQLDSNYGNQLEPSNVAVSHTTPSESATAIALQQDSAVPDTLEQTELEIFNDLFLREAKRSERGAFAPVGGEYVKTIRFSAEQWQQIVQKAVLQKAELEAAQKKAQQHAVEQTKTEQE
ncbi:MAG: RseA family anti-sigma factor [Enterobacterales bacterium]|nr:RseA family anti-sigma factor [Enterobacterales bacterium]